MVDASRPSTIANALLTGEVDWWMELSADLLPMLRRSRNLAFPLLNPSGAIAGMRFNQLHPPFNNPAIRRAILHAVRQSDYMTAILGEDRANWRDGVGYFCPDTPLEVSSDQNCSARCAGSASWIVPYSPTMSSRGGPRSGRGNRIRRNSLSRLLAGT
jgi:ABC-type transport system substrate-binding protein